MKKLKNHKCGEVLEQGDAGKNTPSENCTPEKPPSFHMPFYLAAMCVLLILSFTGEFGYSAMKSSSTGNDSSRVAAYVVSATSNESSRDLSINCNEEGQNVASYTFHVANNKNGNVSEVDISYSIQLLLGVSLPKGITVDIDGVTGILSSDRQTITFTSAEWLFAKNEPQTFTHTMTFTADSDAEIAAANIPNVQITIQTQQID